MKKEPIKKLLDLPFDTAKGLAFLAATKGKGIPTKHYMQNVLIEHEKRNNKVK